MTVTLAELWLPIVLSAVAVFIASFVVYVVLPHHKKDWSKAENEDALMELVRSGIKPGQYMFPHCPDCSALKDPEMKARWEGGPHGIMTVFPGVPSMGRNLALSMLFYLVVSVMVAYVSRLALGEGAECMAVFRFAGTVGVMSYALGFIPGSIWFGSKGKMVAFNVVDGIAFGLITGAIFAWLWPVAALPI